MNVRYVCEWCEASFEMPVECLNHEKKCRLNPETKRCPHGLTFGKDCDADEKCESCIVWKFCYKNKKQINIEYKRRIANESINTKDHGDMS